MTEQRATAKKTGKKTGTKKKAKKSPPSRHYSVYVIELDPAVRTMKKFAKANPNARADKPCLYVGMTGLAPEVRFERHRAGIQDATIVRDYGVKLRPRYYEKLNPMTFEEAKAEEPALAERLRKRGFAVWQK